MTSTSPYPRRSRSGVRPATWIAAPARALCSGPVRLRNLPTTYNSDVAYRNDVDDPVSAAQPQWGAPRHLDRRPRASSLLGPGAASEPADHVQLVPNEQSDES